MTTKKDLDMEIAQVEDVCEERRASSVAAFNLTPELIEKVCISGLKVVWIS